MEFAIGAECKSCKGTGLYKAAYEHRHTAIPCRECEGSGMITIQYTPFTERKKRDDVKRVFMRSGHVIDDHIAGGVNYSEWLKDNLSVYNPENALRELHCPRLYMNHCPSTVEDRYAGKLKLWKQCNTLVATGASIYACPLYDEKEKCWEQFDDEAKQLEE